LYPVHGQTNISQPYLTNHSSDYSSLHLWTLFIQKSSVYLLDDFFYPCWHFD